MFFSGIVSSVLGLIIFKRLDESPIWKQLAQQKAARNASAGTNGGSGAPAQITPLPNGAEQQAELSGASPLRKLFSPPYRRVLLVNLLITIGGGSSYYLTSGYLPTILKVVTKTPNDKAAGILMLGSVGVIIASILSGHLSNLIGRKRTFLGVAVLQLIAGPWLYLTLLDAAGRGSISLHALMIASLGCMGFAPVLIFLNERFPTDIRASGTGLSWNIGFALGGMMPTFVSLVAPTPQALPATLAAFLAGASVFLLVGALIVPETRRQLSDTPVPTR